MWHVSPAPRWPQSLTVARRSCSSWRAYFKGFTVAKLDLVRAIDGSGSLRGSGSKTLKDFAAGLIDKYKGSDFGYEDMRSGVAQFGKGEFLNDGTVSGAC